MAIHEELDDENWDIRETFAYFGRAFYMAGVLEVGLAHALMFGEFLMSVRDRLAASNGKGFSQARHEAEFDEYMDAQFRKTMGNLIKHVEALPYFDANLKTR